MARSRICTVCNLRPTTDESPEGQMCQPCLTEADWENTHSDFDHAGYESWTLRNTNFKTRKDLLAGKADIAEETKSCWVCHPELNEAQREYTPRAGSSRVGVVLTVPLRASAAEKAKLAAELLEAGDAKIRKNNGVTTMKSKTLDMELSWDQRGRYIGGTFGSRKVRNVSDALRLIKA
jgi:hypothetical protein